jgi:oligopeptide/dipeptide ABC transporter ATP-binding protein
MLRIDGLNVEFRTGSVRMHALRGIGLTLRAGKVLGVAGESGSGKTTAALAAMGLLPYGTAVGGSIRYRGQELVGLPERGLRRYRGRHLAMIFQETATALNPVMRVGNQLMMAARTHTRGSKAEVRERVLAAVADVRLADADRVMSSYPHELSGGMCQRVIIAMALSCGSKVLFADEPTTALDVCVQEEILELMRALVTQRRLAVMMISHDLAVLAEICDELAVMYRGEIVEIGAADTVLRRPAHPYTQALLDCLPQLHGDKTRLPELKPAAPGSHQPGGCRFRQRCAWATDVCDQEPELAPVLAGQQLLARCWRSSTVMVANSRLADVGDA